MSKGSGTQNLGQISLPRTNTAYEAEGSAEFANMLNTIRVSKPEENSDADKMLKAREMQLSDSDPAYPNDVLHVYAQNAHW